VQYAAIQEHRMMEAALRVVSEDAFNAAMAPHSAEKIRYFYAKFKPDFQTTTCKKCGTTRTQASWDIDVASMARKVGEPYAGLFLLGYTIPTVEIHATLGSTFDSDTDTDAVSQHDRNDDVKNHLPLIVGTELFLQVLWSQNTLFSLGVDAELDSCIAEFRAVWPDLDSK
jgi:hypothetical protein